MTMTEQDRDVICQAAEELRTALENEVYQLSSLANNAEQQEIIDDMAEAGIDALEQVMYRWLDASK